METTREPKNKPVKTNLPALPLRLIEKLCNAAGVSGDEGEVRKIVLDEIKSDVESAGGDNSVKVDALGNVLVVKRGKGDQRMRVMLAAHMDEVGLMLTRDEGNGFFRFDVVGGIDKRLLPGKAVRIGKDHIPGVIGAKPIHLTTEEERKNAIPVDDLRVDVGPDNKDKVKIGERAVFATQFQRMGIGLRAKALDDRLGVAMLIELLKQNFEHMDLTAAFTVQEEIGLRGAGVAAYALDPQLAIVLDSTPAYDIPHWEYDRGREEETPRYNTHLGAGPALYIADGYTLSDPRLFRFFIETAEACGLPYQVRQPGGGGTDAGAIHLKKEGIPSLSVSVPSRYMHTSAGVARGSDWQNTFALVKAVLERLTPDLLNQER